MMDIDKMEAGRELDFEVADKVMGWEILGQVDTSCYCGFTTGNGLINYGINPQNGDKEPIPLYSTDIAAAWTVFEKLGMPCMIAKSYNGTYGEGPVGYTVNWCGVALCECMEGESCSNGNEVWAETAPLAICRAALMIKAATP